jgi:hypothetical protein
MREEGDEAVGYALAGDADPRPVRPFNLAMAVILAVSIAPMLFE